LSLKKSDAAVEKVAIQSKRTFSGMETMDILFRHTLGIVKMQLEKLYRLGAWEPYLSTRLIRPNQANQTLSTWFSVIMNE
jgi:hypothetical protein